MGRKRNTIEKFIEKYVIKTKTCWQWIGSISNNGYGKCHLDWKWTSPHRAFYIHFKGEIPKGLQIDHLCRNRTCVNPEHMEAVTPKVNTLRSNNPAAMKARQTHCKKGHPLSGDNLYMTPNGRRQCRICNNFRSKKSFQNSRQLCLQ